MSQEFTLSLFAKNLFIFTIIIIFFKTALIQLSGNPLHEEQVLQLIKFIQTKSKTYISPSSIIIIYFKNTPIVK